MWALRIDLTNVTEEQLRAWLARQSGSYLAVREGGETNPHAHVILRGTQGTRAVRKSFLLSFPTCKGNASYSISDVKDESKYNRYMCKGAGPNEPVLVICREGLDYTDEWIKQQQIAFYACAPSRANSGRLNDVVLSKCKAARIEHQEKYKIARQYVLECISRSQGINTFHARGAVNLISCMLCPDDEQVDLLVNEIIFR